MFNRLIVSLVSLMILCTSVGAEQKVGDPSAGERVFKKCKSCHMVGDGAKNRSGPILNGVFGAKLGSIENFKYSKAFNKYSENSIIWDSETLDLFLTKPRDYIPKTKMSFAGLKKAQDRADVIAFLKTYSNVSLVSDDKEPGSGLVLSEEILSIVGDPAYGEYLASECQTCHRADNANEGIPGINGWEIEDFVYALHEYKQKLR
ncbi:MAG: cytochrome C, partial [Marinovum sp.]|nr:cytochrome C [Marinovum sp.]